MVLHGWRRPRKSSYGPRMHDDLQPGTRIRSRTSTGPRRRIFARVFIAGDEARARHDAAALAAKLVERRRGGHRRASAPT